MAGIADPSGFGFLTNLFSNVGGQAQNMLNYRRPTGLKTLQKSEGQIEQGVPQALPGGGLLDQGITGQQAKELLPSEELPLFQEKRGFDLGLAGTEAGAANLGAQTDVLGQQYRAGLASIIGPLLQRLGITTPGTSGLATGGGGFLMKLLGGSI